MGCRASKVDDLPLVIRCRERKRLIKSAVDYRYDLSSSHLAYFHSLKEIGYVLSQFVDEQLMIPSPSPSSPVLTLPSDVGKNNNSGSVSSDSISHLHSIDGGNHDSDSDLSHSFDGHIHIHDDDHDIDNDDNRPHGYNEMNSNEPHVSNREPPAYQGPNQTHWGDPYGYPYQPPWEPNQTGWGEGDPYMMNPSASQYQPPWGPYQADFDSYNRYDEHSNSNPNRYVFFMKKSAPASHTVIQQEESTGYQETNQWIDPPSYDPFVSTYAYGFSYGGEPPPPQGPQRPQTPPPPPPPPMESDYFNFFNAYDNEYHGYGYAYETIDSSPDTTEVREREGIPDLEEETETESHYDELVRTKKFSTKRNTGKEKADIDGSSYKLSSSSTESSFGRKPPGKNEDTTKASNIASTSNSVPLKNKDGAHSGNTDVDKHSSETIVSEITEEGHEGKNGKSFDVDKHSSGTIVSESTEDGHEGKNGKSFHVDEGSLHGLLSSSLSSLTTLSPNGSRDLHEVVNEIKDEFESAFSYGKEVAVMLEAGKLPYQSKFLVLKVILSKILYPLAPSIAHSDHPIQSVRSSSRVTKLARSYNEDAAVDPRPIRPINLSSTLEKLYAWEKKLYKEVKGEERLRVIYEKMCKRLNKLDAKGAEPSKIDAAQTSIRRLKIKLNVSIKAIDAISCEIDKVRDKELQPQVSDLIYGLIRMWQSIVRCHRKQFEAIMESRSRTLRANTSLERDSSLKTTLELETGLVTWAQHFNNWINAQKSYVNSLNGWLQQCIHHKPEVTIDGEVPYSPSRLGAPPIFIICNDWYREIKNVSQESVLKAMRSFAINLRQLIERQDDMRRVMLKNDLVRKSQTRRPDEPHGSMVPSEDRVSLDYKEAMRLVQNGGLSSLQGGVIPIFKALEMFTRNALKAHEKVRLVA